MKFDTEKLESFKQAIKAKEDEYKNFGKQLFKDYIKEYFKTYPEIQAVVFAAYTPYFNDGDTCEYSINDPVYVLEGFDPQNLLRYYDYEYNDSIKSAVYNDINYKNYEEFNKFMQQNTELLKGIFGDHVCVYITPEEIITEEYEHD